VIDLEADCFGMRSLVLDYFNWQAGYTLADKRLGATSSVFGLVLR
jgi:hypothetical protein